MSLKLAQLLLLANVASHAIPCFAQQPPAVPSQRQLSPRAAFQEAMRPVVITRASLANWSDIEQASLAVAIKQASVACAARTPTDYSGAPLVDLGRLCGLALTWHAAAEAASRYIAEEATPKPRLAEAYSILINADLQLKDEPSALKNAEAVLAAVPYTSLVAESTSQAIGYMHLVYPEDAIVLTKKRQPLVLAALRSTAVTASEASDAIPTTPELYKQALALAELQQLQGQTSAAQETISALESAIPRSLSTDDELAIEGMRRRYTLIGKPLPAITPLSFLQAGAQIPTLPARRAITVLMLYPDWCAQCVRLARQIPTTVFAVEEHNAYMYGLLAQTVPPQRIPKPGSKNEPMPNPNINPAYVADSLRGTSTLTVAPSLLDTFNATELPLLIVTDGDGIVRLLDVANETALQPGDMVDAAVALIGRQSAIASK